MVGVTERSGRVRAEQELFYLPTKCLVVGFAEYFGQSDLSVPESITR